MKILIVSKMVYPTPRREGSKGLLFILRVLTKLHLNLLRDGFHFVKHVQENSRRTTAFSTKNVQPGDQVIRVSGD